MDKQTIEKIMQRSEELYKQVSDFQQLLKQTFPEGTLVTITRSIGGKDVTTETNLLSIGIEFFHPYGWRLGCYVVNPKTNNRLFCVIQPHKGNVVAIDGTPIQEQEHE